jgi:putative proteasome-type protease
MTYCLGIKVKTGLVAIADTRLTSGTEVTTAKKVSVHQVGNHSLFIMTSGLRSVRDKAVTYFEEVLETEGHNFKRLHRAVNAFGQQVRQVAREDREPLETSGLAFNLFAIVGGKLEEDKEHKLFLLYPQGNWVEIEDETFPFFAIGNSNYGKPLLFRSLKSESSLSEALKIGFLSFDSTRVSASDVDYPLDVVIFDAENNQIIEHRYEKDDLAHLSLQWSMLLKNSVQRLPNDWMDVVMDKIGYSVES